MEVVNFSTSMKVPPDMARGEMQDVRRSLSGKLSQYYFPMQDCARDHSRCGVDNGCFSCH